MTGSAGRHTDGQAASPPQSLSCQATPGDRHGCRIDAVTAQQGARMCAQRVALYYTMGTPASVVSSPAAGWQAPEPRCRKKASADIFKDIDLLQLQTLFRAGGDECAEERAQIIYDYAGDRRISEALMKLRKKKRNKSFTHSSHTRSSDRIGSLSMQKFSKLCINETSHRGSTSSEEDSDRQDALLQDRPPISGTKKLSVTQRTKNKLRQHQQQRRISGYLHQIKR